MKCIKNVKTGVIIRVENHEARQLVKTGEWNYSSKSAYKHYKNNIRVKYSSGIQNREYFIDGVCANRKNRRSLLQNSSSTKVSKYSVAYRRNRYKKYINKVIKGTSPTGEYIGKEIIKSVVSKAHVAKLAMSDGFTISFNGKEKVCYISGTLDIPTIQAYKQLLPEYRFVNNG